MRSRWEKRRIKVRDAVCGVVSPKDEDEDAPRVLLGRMNQAPKASTNAGEDPCVR